MVVAGGVTELSDAHSAERLSRSMISPATHARRDLHAFVSVGCVAWLHEVDEVRKAIPQALQAQAVKELESQIKLVADELARSRHYYYRVDAHGAMVPNSQILRLGAEGSRKLISDWAFQNLETREC
jgi:hypothetical protein